MNIKKIIIGNTTEVLLRTIFDNRIAEESTSDTLNRFERAIKIRDLKTQVMRFIKDNPNSNFTVIAPEYKSVKKLQLQFSNYATGEWDDDEKFSNYVIEIEDNFVTATINQQVEAGRPIRIIIEASK